MQQDFQQLLMLPVPLLDSDFNAATDQLLRAYEQAMARILAPFLLIAIVGPIVGCVFQFGFLLSAKSVTPSLGKLSPMQYVKKTISIQNIVEFLKSIIKILTLSLFIVFVIRDALRAIVLSPTCGYRCVEGVLGQSLTQLLIWSSSLFFIVAAADMAYQRYSFKKKNMMTKDEVKREYKESEGDPHVKGKRKQLYHEMMAEGQVSRSRKATVLVTNPTHVAVAIYYEAEETPLPVVTAIGTDAIARRMIEAAREAEVPIMQDVPLARSLLETGIVDQYIPSELIEPFAEILRALRSLSESGVVS
jgi:type III secretion protein U